MCQHILGPGSAAASCFPSFTRTAYEEQAHPTSPHPNSGPGRHSPLYQGFLAPSSIPSPNPSCRIVFRKASELRVLAQGMQEPWGKEKQILVDRHLPSCPDLNTCTQKGCLLPQRTEAQLYIPVRSTDRQTSSQMASALRNRAEQKNTAQEKPRMRSGTDLWATCREPAHPGEQAQQPWARAQGNFRAHGQPARRDSYLPEHPAGRLP